MTTESIRTRNARIISSLTASMFDPEHIRTDEEARAYASRLAEAGYELGFLDNEFCAVPADGSPMDPAVMAEAMDAVYEIRQLADAEHVETATRALMEREGRLNEILAYGRPVIEAADAENCRRLLGDRSTDDNARTLCAWLNEHMYELSMDRRGNVRARLNGQDLYPATLDRAVRLALGDADA